MRVSWSKFAGWWALSLAAVIPWPAPAGAQEDSTQAIVSAGTNTLASHSILREIDDPHSGQRWLLLRDDNHPGGPGRLVLASRPGQSGPNATGNAPDSPQAVIRSGDRVIVEEHTPQVDAVLEAIALGSALPGGTFRLRLRVGGGIVQAVATRAGHANLAPNPGRQP